MREGVRREPWLGGYVRITPKGRTYVIDKWVKGVHFHKSTRCSTERAALKQLERFEAAPYGYSPLGEAPRDALTITHELVQEFRRYLTEGKKDTQDWADSCARVLADWAEDFEGRDLRELSLQSDVKPSLLKRRGRKSRIVALKHFCSWLRKEKGLMKSHEDVTRDLPVPQVSAAKTRRRRVVDTSSIRAVLPYLQAITRDILTLQLGTAWHIEEVRRFSRVGEIVRPTNQDPLAVLVTPHKSGDLTRTPIRTKEHLDAAERVLAAKWFPGRWAINNHLREACDKVREAQRKAGVEEKKLMPHWRLGSLRHTVLTRAVEMGATPEQAAQFANHRSSETTKKFYLDISVPTVSVPVLRLVSNTEDETVAG